MMRIVAWPAALLAILGVVGCNGGDDDLNGECDNSITSTFPEQNATNAFYRTDIEVRFLRRDDGASLSVSGPEGDISGSSHWRGNTLVFSPNNPLSPESSYTVTIDYECGDPSVSFTTSEVGAPVDLSDLEDAAYELLLSSGRFVEPEGVGDLLGEFIDQSVLVGVVEATASDIQLVGAIAEEGSIEQDVCTETIDFPLADFSENPFFIVEADSTTITVQDVSVTIDDLIISGAFSPDGSYIAGAVLAGSIDTRPLVDLVDEGGEDDTICDLALAIGVSCEPCADGGVYCLSLYVDSIAADGITGPVVPIDDPSENPDCVDDD